MRGAGGPSWVIAQPTQVGTRGLETGMGTREKWPLLRHFEMQGGRDAVSQKLAQAII